MKTIRIISIVLLALLSINALLAGYSFMCDPSGSGLGIDTTRLKFSPFRNYFIPGLVLFVANGLLGSVTAVMVVIKHNYYPLVVLIQGIILVGWIIVQVIFLREFNFLHLLFIAIGSLLVFLGIRADKLKTYKPD
jgi:hypothetical protein